MPAARILHFPKAVIPGAAEVPSPPFLFAVAPFLVIPSEAEGPLFAFPAVVPNPSAQFADGGEGPASHFFSNCPMVMRRRSARKTRVLAVLARVRFFFRFRPARIHATNPKPMGYASTAVLSSAPRTVFISPLSANLILARFSVPARFFPASDSHPAAKTKKRRAKLECATKESITGPPSSPASTVGGMRYPFA
jgi:hypothetical protein